MSGPIDIFGKFVKLGLVNEDNIETFKRLGGNTIHMRLKNRKEIVFTYISSNKWQIESMDLYLNRKKDEKRS